jgi:hypothetical protein
MEEKSASWKRINILLEKIIKTKKRTNKNATLNHYTFRVNFCRSNRFTNSPSNYNPSSPPTFTFQTLYRLIDKPPQMLVIKTPTSATAQTPKQNKIRPFRNNILNYKMIIHKCYVNINTPIKYLNDL